LAEGCSAPMLPFPQLRELRVPAGVVATAGLRLVALAAIVACCTLFATVAADGNSDATGFHRSRLEAAAPSGSDPGCRSRCGAVLRNNAVLRRSLAQHADSVTACEARAGTLAWELREAKLTAKRLMQDNAALRRRLKAVPEAAHSAAEIPRPGTAGLQARSSHAAQLGPDPRRTAYHPTLPVSGALTSLSPARAVRTRHARASMDGDCRAFAAVPHGAALPAVEAERTAPPPSLARLPFCMVRFAPHFHKLDAPRRARAATEGIGVRSGARRRARACTAAGPRSRSWCLRPLSPPELRFPSVR
jgi:hypothetical protein